MSIGGTALHMQALTMHGGLPNSTSGDTLLDATSSPPFTACAAVCALVLLYLVLRCVRYFTSELPPLQSGLKRLPGPWSTLTYLGRIHDVDRLRAWNAMKKFSDQYDGLFAMILGGETHIWVAREDIAQGLLVRNAAISSARADLGANPGVTQNYKYLPLLYYTEALHRQNRFAYAMMSRNVAHNHYGYIDSEVERLMHVDRPFRTNEKHHHTEGQQQDVRRSQLGGQSNRREQGPFI